MTVVPTTSRTPSVVAHIPAPARDDGARAASAPEGERSAGILCTRAAARRGLRASPTVSLGTLVWGISAGVISVEAGFSGINSVLMSLLVFSGSAQVVAMQMVSRDAGIFAILLATTLVSLRYIMMGITMRGWLDRAPRWLAWPGMQYLSDQSWAMTIQQFRDGRRDVGYFFGLNTGMLAIWVAGTALGVSLGSWLGGHVTGLHFAATAALVGVLAQMKCRRRDILPWVVTAVVAIGASKLVDGAWYVLIGIAAGLVVILAMGEDDAGR